MEEEGRGMQGASCMWIWGWSGLVCSGPVPDHCPAFLFTSVAGYLLYECAHSWVCWG